MPFCALPLAVDLVLRNAQAPMLAPASLRSAKQCLLGSIPLVRLCRDPSTRVRNLRRLKKCVSPFCTSRSSRSLSALTIGSERLRTLRSSFTHGLPKGISRPWTVGAGRRKHQKGAPAKIFGLCKVHERDALAVLLASGCRLLHQSFSLISHACQQN